LVGDYLLYTTNNPGYNGRIFYLKNMKTGEIRTLMENQLIGYGRAYFFPEHMANYYFVT